MSADVSEGKRPDCQEAKDETKSGDSKDEAKTAEESRAAKRAKVKSAGNRRIPSFLRRVDLLFQGR